MAGSLFRLHGNDQNDTGRKNIYKGSEEAFVDLLGILEQESPLQCSTLDEKQNVLVFDVLEILMFAPPILSQIHFFHFYLNRLPYDDELLRNLPTRTYSDTLEALRILEQLTCEFNYNLLIVH